MALAWRWLRSSRRVRIEFATPREPKIGPWRMITDDVFSKDASKKFLR